MTALDAIIDALWVVSGLTLGTLTLAAVAHHLVGAARGTPADPPNAQSWAARVDPDLLLPLPTAPRQELWLLDQHGRVTQVVHRHGCGAPPRERVPEVRRG